jgi:hypothetical protein
MTQLPAVNRREGGTLTSAGIDHEDTRPRDPGVTQT